MGSFGKEDKLSMETAAYIPSSPSITEGHRPAESHSSSCVECMGVMACIHARARVDVSPSLSSSSEVDLMIPNSCGTLVSPSPCHLMSPAGIHAVHADMHVRAASTSPNVPYLSLVQDYHIEGTAAPQASSQGAPSTQKDSQNAVMSSSFSLQTFASEAVMSRRAFMCNYFNTLLPALRRIHGHSVSCSLDEKLSAVKLAADMSLAISAGSNNTWSQALLKEVASSSTCMPLLPLLKARSSRKCARKMQRKAKPLRSSFSAKRKRSRVRSSAHAMKGKHVGSTYGSSIISSSADYLSDCSHGFSHLPEARQPRLRRVMLKRPPCRSGLSSYLRNLRSSRCKKKQKRNKASSLSPDEESRAVSPGYTKEHIESLGGLVPGGRNMDVPLLLQEAADYILSLQMQVEALQSLSHFVSS